MADALVKAERWNEAEIYLDELVSEIPNSGPVNLGLGRIAIQRGDYQTAVEYYHTAIYGNWSENSPVDKVQIRLELISYLGNADRLKQVRIELLALVAESPDDLMLRKNLAHLLLNYGLPTESAQLFQEIIEKNPQDWDAFAGLGHANFALGNYLSAQRAFKKALGNKPEDVESKQKLEVVDRILDLDPNLRGLRTVDRYRRSRILIEETLKSLNQCVIGEATPLSISETEAVAAARKSLDSKSKPRSYSAAMEANLDLAEQVWEMRISMCGQYETSDEALTILMTQLSK